MFGLPQAVKLSDGRQPSLFVFGPIKAKLSVGRQLSFFVFGPISHKKQVSEFHLISLFTNLLFLNTQQKILIAALCYLY